MYKYTCVNMCTLTKPGTHICIHIYVYIYIYIYIYTYIYIYIYIYKLLYISRYPKAS